VAEVGRFCAEEGCTPTDWRRVTGRPTESLLPSRPIREVDRSRFGVAATRAPVARVPTRCDGIVCFFCASRDETDGDLSSARGLSLLAALNACRGVPVCGEECWLFTRAGEAEVLRDCPFRCSKTRRALLTGVEAADFVEVCLAGLPRKTLSRTIFHLLGVDRF
jgi:hypothetical protein